MAKTSFFSLGKKFRAAEKELTKGLLKWRLKKSGMPPADEETLDRGSQQIVNEAHRILKQSGKGVIEELKLAKKELLKAYHDEEKKKD